MKITLFLTTFIATVFLAPTGLPAQTTNRDPGGLNPELQTIVQSVQSKLKAGKNTEVDLAADLVSFDQLLAKHAGEKTDDVAQILYMKAMLYLQVLDNADKGKMLIQKLKSDYPDTKLGKRADQMLMMPSSRAEIWVAYRNGSSPPTTPPSGTSAILLDSGYNTGPAGDTWPAVNLAQIKFTPVGTANPPPYLLTSGVPLTISNPLQITQDANQDQTTASITPDQGVTVADCVPLAQGHRRRIYFNVATDYPDLFGLGYEEVDTNKSPDKFGIYPAVPNTYKPVTEFNGAMPTVCLTLGPNNVPIPETWELVNLSGENHNFHIHQTKFQVVAEPPESGTKAPSNGAFAHIDNVPVIHANGAVDPNSPNFNKNSPGGCLSVDDWKSGACRSTPTVVRIPFFVAGDYVFHCHILEHEDGGMMARIRVRILGRN